MTEASEDIQGWPLRSSDACLTALLTIQCLTIFGAIPLMALNSASHWLLDLSHLIFASVCALALTNRSTVRIALLVSLLAIAGGPTLLSDVSGLFSVSPEMRHETISLLALGFNILVTALVARRAFGDGLVTGHRIQGAVLVYLNVAAIFAIAYDLLDTLTPGALRATSGGMMAFAPSTRIPELAYFSFTTITTTGYGDIIPVHPLARSLANLESMFGQLFPATLVARLVGLHLVHRSDTTRK